MHIESLYIAVFDGLTSIIHKYVIKCHVVSIFNWPICYFSCLFATLFGHGLNLIVRFATLIGNFVIFSGHFAAFVVHFPIPVVFLLHSFFFFNLSKAYSILFVSNKDLCSLGLNLPPPLDLSFLVMIQTWSERHFPEQSRQSRYHFQ